MTAAPIKTVNKGGRPKKAGPLLTMKERNTRRKAKLERSGGRTLPVALSAEECAALETLKARHGLTKDRDVIGLALILGAKGRAKPAAKAPPKP